MSADESLLTNTTFWYSVAVGVFVLFGLWKVSGPFLGWLDSEIAKVRAELDEAKRLRAEAEATLQKYRDRQDDAEREAEHIILEAQQTAARLRKQAEINLREALERQEHLFEARLRVAQEEAAAEVRNFIIDEVMTQARGKLQEMKDSKEAHDMLDHVIEALPELQKKHKSA
ncbi:MAG: F0F1 ATP synthase subunit B [Alphaproteobacteria bacterium]|nr:F0F1 ATP synthase subunit B [Alphaproteobacteria bacterium]